MPSVARVSDVFVGVCDDHNSVSGVIITGSSDFFVDGLSVARVGDIGLSDCGHMTLIVSGSGKTSNKTPVARVGDAVAGTVSGVIVSGSPTTSIG